MELAKWFKAHELRLMGGDGELSAEANEALAYLVRRGESPVSVRMAKNTLRKKRSFQKSETLDLALLELRDAGYIRMIAPVRDETRGRPGGEALMLHPGLLRGSGEEQAEQHPSA